LPCDLDSICIGGVALVVESSDNVRKGIAASLMTEGFSVVEMGTGSQLDIIALAKENSPDVMFLDASFPRTDAGECVRVLERFEGTRGVVIVITCPRDVDASHLARLEASGALLVLVKPLTRDGIAQALRQAIEESRERRSRMDARVRRKAPSATKHVATNNSLLVRTVQCPFHETPVPVNRYILRTGKIQTDTSFFDLPVYKSAVAGAQFVNFNLLCVAVCPRCLFATNNPAYFADPADRKSIGPGHTPGAIAAIAATTGQRLARAGELPEHFFDENRTVAGAMLAYELAIECGKTLFESNRAGMTLEMLRLGNYHMRLAALHEKAKSDAAALWRNYNAALEWLRQAFTVLEGAALYKTIYQLVALSIALGNDRSAHQFVQKLAELQQTPIENRDDRAALERYLARSQKAWEDRGVRRVPWAAAA
jgi:CheY-like chemotaxis protein